MRSFIQPFLTSLFRPLAAGLIAMAASTAPAGKRRSSREATFAVAEASV